MDEEQKESIKKIIEIVENNSKDSKIMDELNKIKKSLDEI